MKQPVRHETVPIGRDGFEHGVDVGPQRQRRKREVLVRAAIEHLHPILREVYECDLRMMQEHLVAYAVDFGVPAPAYKHKTVVVEVVECDDVAFGEFVVDGNGAPERLARKLEAQAPALFKKGIVENPHHDIHVLPEVRQTARRRGCVFKRDHLKAHARATFLHLRPQLRERRTGRHERHSHADDALLSTLGDAGACD